MRKTFQGIVDEIRQTTNPVTRWALKMCLMDRIDRCDFS